MQDYIYILLTCVKYTPLMDASFYTFLVVKIDKSNINVCLYAYQHIDSKYFKI